MNNRKQMYRQLLIAALTGLAFQPVSVSLYAYPAKASSHLAQADTTKVSEDEYTKLVKDDHSEKVECSPFVILKTTGILRYPIPS